MRAQLNGIVVSNDYADMYRRWGYKDICCPNDIRAMLEACSEDEDLILEVNSPGGGVYAGFEMYSLIRNSGKNVTAEVQSLAGSAMSVIVSACSNVLMSPVANIMIHRSSIPYASGNAESLEQDAQMLNTMDESILNAYCEKVGDKTDRTTLRHMMKNETFLTAQEAIDCGLADGILDAGSGTTDPTLAVACMGGLPQVLSKALATAANLPPIEDLKRLETEIDSEGNTSAVENNDAEEREKMEITDIKTTEELKAALPDLTKQIIAEAQTAERNRITAIDAVAMPGFEKIIADAKADPSKTAGDVAQEIIAQQKKQGVNFLTATEKDVMDSKVNDVTAARSAGEQEMTLEQEAKAAAAADVAYWKEHK